MTTRLIVKIETCVCVCLGGGGGGGGGGRGKGGGDGGRGMAGMLVVSLRDVNCRFWFHLGCLGWKVTILAHSGIA